MPRCIAVLVAVAALVAATPAPHPRPQRQPELPVGSRERPGGGDRRGAQPRRPAPAAQRLATRTSSSRDTTGSPTRASRRDGTVSVNRNSPAFYLNEERFGGAEAPEEVRNDPQAEPDWERIDASGRFEWHDHRAHWMGSERPDQVQDPDQRTVVFDWSVPTSRGPITGTLFWTPSPGAPVAFIIIGSAVVLILCAAAIVVRRRRDATERMPEAW